MRRALIASIALALAGCSLLYDGSEYVTPVDAGGTDAPAPVDAQAPVPCETRAQCSADEQCDDGECRPCDQDGDGFSVAACDPATPADCDDGDPNVHPGALPVCGNGVDESCASTAPVDLGLNAAADEVGFIPARPIDGPPDRPYRLRVRALEGDPTRALVLWQIADGRGTVMTSVATLGESSIAARPLQEVVDGFTLPAGATNIGYDVQTEEATGASFVGVLFVDADAGLVRAQSAQFRPDGSAIGGDATVITPPADMPAFGLEGAPSLVRGPSGGGMLVAVIGSYAEGGLRRRTLVQVDVSAGTIRRLSPDATEQRWSRSDGRAAVFPGFGGSILAWNGVSGADEPQTARILPSAPMTGEPSIHVLRAPDGGPAYTVLVPQASQIQVLQGACPADARLTECGFDSARAFATGWGTGRVSFSSVRFSDTSYGVLWGEQGVSATSLRFASVETEGTPTETLTTVEIPAPGVGNIQETAASVAFAPLAGGGGHVTIVYALVRGNDTSGRVSVGAVRACVGAGGV